MCICSLLKFKLSCINFNQIKSNQIKSNQIKSNQIKPNQIKKPGIVHVQKLSVPWHKGFSAWHSLSLTSDSRSNLSHDIGLNSFPELITKLFLYWVSTYILGNLAFLPGFSAFFINWYALYYFLSFINILWLKCWSIFLNWIWTVRFVNKIKGYGLGVFFFRVTFGTEMQGRQKVATFCKIFKNDFLKIRVLQLIKISPFFVFSQKL